MVVPGPDQSGEKSGRLQTPGVFLDGVRTEGELLLALQDHKPDNNGFVADVVLGFFEKGREGALDFFRKERKRLFSTFGKVRYSVILTLLDAADSSRWDHRNILEKLVEEGLVSRSSLGDGSEGE